MYCRTVGAIVPLLIETGRLPEAEQTINCVLTAMQQNHLYRIPHVIDVQGNHYTIISHEPQIDGQAHVIMAWQCLLSNAGIQTLKIVPGRYQRSYKTNLRPYFFSAWQMVGGNRVDKKYIV